MHFTYNGISSEIYNLKIKSSNHLSRAAKKIESIEIPGRTGNLIIDDGSLQNKQIELVCTLDCRQYENIHVVAKQIGDWLQGPIGYQTLTMSDGMSFKAVCTNQIDINQLLKHFAEVSIRFDATEVTT